MTVRADRIPIRQLRSTGDVREFMRWLPARIGYQKGPRLMSWLRKRWVLLRHPHATIRFGRDVYLGPGFSVWIPDEGTLIVGDGVEFRRDFRAEISGSGRVTIGSGSRFTYSVLIQCTTTIDIGERCMFGQTAILLDGQHRFRDLTRPMLEQGYDFTPLVIEDDAVITSKCSIMASVGRRAVIGANSVVTKPIPPYSIAVGAPARVIERFGPRDQADTVEPRSRGASAESG
jgi:acetyltransferase-like isoleucine patch superfamily enzyme